MCVPSPKTLSAHLRSYVFNRSYSHTLYRWRSVNSLIYLLNLLAPYKYIPLAEPLHAVLGFRLLSSLGSAHSFHLVSPHTWQLLPDHLLASGGWENEKWESKQQQFHTMRSPPSSTITRLLWLCLLPSQPSCWQQPMSWRRLRGAASRLDTSMTGTEAATKEVHSFPPSTSSWKSSTATKASWTKC